MRPKDYKSTVKTVNITTTLRTLNLWSLLTGGRRSEVALCYKKWNWGPKIVDVIRRWSLPQVGLYFHFKLCKIIFVSFQIARERAGSSPELPLPKFTSLKSMSGSEDGLDRTLNPATPAASSSAESQQQRAHSSVHVCWHRCTTVPVCYVTWIYFVTSHEFILLWNSVYAFRTFHAALVFYGAFPFFH